MLALIIAVLCIVAISALVGVAVAQARSLRVTRLSISVHRWPRSAGSLRIAHLSDLHLPHLPVPRDRLLRAITDIDPHLTIISGDTLTWNADTDAAVSLIGRLAAHGPVLCVLGNVEHMYDLDIEAFAAAIEPAGGLLLRDEEWRGTIAGANVSVLGLEDRETEAPDSEDALTDAPSADLAVVVAHSPAAWLRVPRQRTHVFLCGHTHGGQLCVPVLGRLLAHSRMEWELKSGVFELPDEGSDWTAIRPIHTHGELCADGRLRQCDVRPGRPLMCITRGVGCVMLPMRLGSPPEVVGITVGGEMAGDASGETEVQHGSPKGNG